jgi:hypothetical protein
MLANSHLTSDHIRLMNAEAFFNVFFCDHGYSYLYSIWILPKLIKSIDLLLSLYEMNRNELRKN